MAVVVLSLDAPAGPHRAGWPFAMCYADGGLLGFQLSACAVADDLLDCRADDYFSTAPTAGSYLAEHWNPADSSYLDRTAPPAAAPSTGIGLGINGGSKLRAGISGTYRAPSTTPGEQRLRGCAT